VSVVLERAKSFARKAGFLTNMMCAPAVMARVRKPVGLANTGILMSVVRFARALAQHQAVHCVVGKERFRAKLVQAPERFDLTGQPNVSGKKSLTGELESERTKQLSKNR
jgi:hypothetical protein